MINSISNISKNQSNQQHQSKSYKLIQTHSNSYKLISNDSNKRTIQKNMESLLEQSTSGGLLVSTSTKPSTPTKSTNNANVMKRLQSELMTLMMTAAPGISAFPTDSNFLFWIGTITGPEDTPYSDLTFKLSFQFPNNYPYSPPTVLFKTPIYHPNIDFSGRICLDILKEKWSAIYNVQSILLSLQSLLGEPNNASPLNGEAAELWDKDTVEFKKKVLGRHKDLSDDEINSIDGL